MRAGEQFLARGERWERRQWRKKRPERVAAVDKIEEKRKPEDFIGHRNRKSPLTTDGNPQDCWQLSIMGCRNLPYLANMQIKSYCPRLFFIAFSILIWYHSLRTKTDNGHRAAHDQAAQKGVL